MTDDDSDGWVTPAVEKGREAVRSVRDTFLGIQRERFACPDCGVPCEPTHTHDPRRAAFDGGASPAWKCSECGSEYVREVDDDAHTADLYGRE